MNFSEQLKARWAALAMRERQMVGGAIALVALALLWWIALAPALRTLAAAPAEHAQLDAQLQQMATLQNRAKALQSQPRLARDEALRSLETSVREGLGVNNAQLMTAGGDGATVTLRATPASTVAQWLAQARGNAHAVPREVHLTRAPAAPPAPGNKDKDAPQLPQVRWEGTVVMALPAPR
ncbi:general secretion pathway protein M [Variovorax boronicumulans]|uniref:General secretion pathway protein M n=1 Tax=Variovorax boronicumulans TaxID=436515 RepID=A0AAW8D3X5_9BURK|nr:type II secretion system protein GspM [Variovorax boronicumulans]MDP9895169.1 general secretion pathway protein M [Variovorax boronicumulans]MDQ0054987.1 general secretion pathway protein M [Variovorax boronicumulans]